MVAEVEPLGGAALDDDELRRYCKRRLSGYKVPQEFLCVERIALTSTGKIIRRSPRSEGVRR